MRRGQSKTPTMVEKTDLYTQDPGLAIEMWAQGFREVYAKDLKIGMRIQFYQSFGGFAFGQRMEARVLNVTHDESQGSVCILIDGRDSEDVDELEPCWAREADDEYRD